MKSKELLREIVKAYPDVVAIAMNESSCVNVFKKQIPFIQEDVQDDDYWVNKNREYFRFQFPNIIEWDSENWKENIITINDL